MDAAVFVNGICNRWNIPLALDLASGNLILVVAVLSIITTAPLGAFMIEHTYQKLLQKN